MAASYRTPGVYVEWLDASSQQLDVVRTDVAGFVGVAQRGPVHRPTKIESAQQFLSTFGEAVPQAYLAYAVRGFFDNGGRTCWVVRVANPAGATRARVRIQIEGGDQVSLRATSEGAWGNDVRIEPLWQGDAIVRLRAVAPDDRTQEIPLRDPGSRDIARRVQTNLLGVRDQLLQELQAGDIVERDPDGGTDLPVVTLGAGAPPVYMRDGADGLGTVTLDHFTGDPTGKEEWGVAALERIDGIAFVAVPDLMAGQRSDPQDAAARAFDPADVSDAQIRIINSCMGRRDRMAILDLPPVDRRAAIACKKAWPETSYAAVYYPWIVVDDPLALRNGVRAVPPSGHVAGMYARTDRLRGVHKPPANEILEGVWDLTETIDSDAHGELNDSGVNAIRAMPGRGILVLGARTLHSDVRWRYVNVRRLIAMIEDTLDEQMNWLTFEPNNPALWRQIDRTIRAFLERLYRAGMLDGATADDAYRVRCDESTNPPAETDEGRVTCIVGVQPPYPAEFVVVRIGVTRSGIEIEEKGAQDV